jgi:signal transduction histidine kinase
MDRSEGGTMLPVETLPVETSAVEPTAGGSAGGSAPAADALKSDRGLLSSVCHDLKDPLASIVMGAGFLRRTLSPDDAAALRVVDAIHRAAERMNRLISNFSDLARLQAREVLLVLRADDPGAIVKTAYDQFLPEATVQQVAVSLEIEPELPEVPCDRARLGQAVRHLGACALRVVPDGGSIVMRARRDGLGAVRVEVTARRPPGAGSRRVVAEPPKPELAIARALVELHGASLTVTGDGDALVLSFVLPRVLA